MEFLMTYGWAILVVLAAIGALAYFGVLSPSKILPSSCTVGAGFGCRDYKATSAQIDFKLLNNLGTDIQYAEIDFDGSPADAGCTVIAADETGWAAGVSCAGVNNCTIYYNAGGTFSPLRTGSDFATLTFTCPASSLSGNAVIDYTIFYNAVGESLWHEVDGKANLKVES